MRNSPANLMPPQRLLARQLHRRRQNWIVGLSAYLIPLVAISIAARQFWPVGSPTLAAELTDSTQQITRLTAQVTKQRKIAADYTARQTLMNSISDTPDWSLMLRLIDQAVSDDIAVRQTQLQETTDGHYNLSIHGVARSQSSVSQFALRLQQSGLFKEIRLGRSEREPFLNASAISFDLACPIDGLSGALP